MDAAVNKGMLGYPRGNVLEPELFEWPLGSDESHVEGDPPIAGAIAWYDASDRDTLTLVDGAISDWLDKSGSGFHAAQATAAARPRYGVRPINGLGSALFDGIDDEMLSSAPRDDRTSTTFVAGILDKTPLAGTAVTMLGSQGGTDGNSFDFDSSRALRTNQDQIATIAIQSNASAVLGRPFVAVQALTDTDCTQYLDGVSETDADVSTFTATRTLRIGASASAAFYQGAIGEILLYDTTLTSAEILATIDHLKLKWGAPRFRS